MIDRSARASHIIDEFDNEGSRRERPEPIEFPLAPSPRVAITASPDDTITEAHLSGTASGAVFIPTTGHPAPIRLIPPGRDVPFGGMKAPSGASTTGKGPSSAVPRTATMSGGTRVGPTPQTFAPVKRSK